MQSPSPRYRGASCFHQTGLNKTYLEFGRALERFIASNPMAYALSWKTETVGAGDFSHDPINRALNIVPALAAGNLTE